MPKLNMGFAFTGSFCTFDKVISELQNVVSVFSVTPIMSPAAAFTDTRFGKASDFRQKISHICQSDIILTVPSAEPVGPKKLFDIMVIAPCTGNTLAKLASGITDTSVTMAAKAHLRNERPLLLAPSTNDGLGANAKNIGSLLNTKNIYFVPFGQDDPFNKHKSLVSDFSAILPAAAEALCGNQLQPLLLPGGKAPS